MNKFTSDTRKLDSIIGNLRANQLKASKQVADDVAELARGLAPVLTGDLRDSIYVEETGVWYAVVADSDHAVPVELGTSAMAAQPYLGPAVMKIKKNLAKYYKRVVTNGS